ncbi:uncharacterized protein LOC129600460 [Paramacrobiotus metropolitanus]|uniref:uncharacterized protein LOC129600460 n=1 Tax=Paramacrobiotus metropolitanus TaxID=2943436 RepID=UPI002445FD23|nr:uncharacterized protein LOC129600460 [Paramacrobiotus metropolitanus]
MTLTAEHVQTGKLFTELQQKFQGTDVYLSGEDAKQLQQEIASNVMAAEIADAEFIGGDQSPTLMHFIGEALKLQETTSAWFTPKMWESVYWKEENARPDKITREYQDSFDKQDQETQHRIMDYFKKQESEKKCGNANFGIEGAGAVEVSACTNKGSSNSQRDEMEDYLRNINEGRKVTEMKGTRFIRKELALKQTNLASLKQTTNFGSLSIRISKIVGVMKTRFNYAGSLTETADATYPSDGSLTIHKKQPSDIREAFYVRAARTSVTFTKPQASNICRDVFRCELATLAHMPVWVAVPMPRTERMCAIGTLLKFCRTLVLKPGSGMMRPNRA